MHSYSFIKLYMTTLGVLALIDIPWIMLVANQFYRSQIGHLMADKAQFWPALIFYTFYAAALVIFAIIPGIQNKSIAEACLKAALLGFVCYGAYDLTNQATLKDWPLMMTLVDMAWGTVMSTVVTFIVSSLA